jgi:hypothetical protein
MIITPKNGETIHIDFYGRKFDISFLGGEKYPYIRIDNNDEKMLIAEVGECDTVLGGAMIIVHYRDDCGQIEKSGRKIKYDVLSEIFIDKLKKERKINEKNS